MSKLLSMIRLILPGLEKNSRIHQEPSRPNSSIERWSVGITGCKKSQELKSTFLGSIQFFFNAILHIGEFGAGVTYPIHKTSGSTVSANSNLCLIIDSVS